MGLIRAERIDQLFPDGLVSLERSAGWVKSIVPVRSTGHPDSSKSAASEGSHDFGQSSLTGARQPF